MKNLVIIRDRGQLTIPDSIRKMVSWVNPMSAVTISIVKPDEILIKPHARSIDKELIWENIRKARSIKGKGKIMSATDFLAKDRQSH